MRKTIYDPSYRRLTTLLRQARMAAELRQAEVAKRLGIARSWVSKVESNELRLDVLACPPLLRARKVLVEDPDARACENSKSLLTEKCDHAAEWRAY